MSKNILDEILSEEIRGAKQTPSVKDVVAMLTGKADKRSIAKPAKKYTGKERATKIAELKAKRDGTDGAEVGGSGKEDFLKQIEDYNDFIVQNDLDIEKINPDHDYDFSAFTSPADWAVESERLADRLSDRKIEIQQNEDAGEFAGMELENGMPSYEATKNMSDEEYAAYEKKYLDPSTDNAIEEEVVSSNYLSEEEPVVAIDEQIKVDEARPEFAEDLKKEIIRQDFQRNGEPRIREEVPVEVIEPVVREVIKPKVKKAVNKPSTLDLKTLAMNSLPYPVKTALDSALEAVNSGKKVIDQGEPINALQDGARGIMSGLADTAGSIADLGGLVPNSVADEAHKSAKWWEDQYEIPDSEAGNIGTNLGTEAVAGVAGGVVGKAAGTGYRALKESGETLRKRATTVAKDTEKRAKLYGQSPLEAAIARQKVYENMTNVPPRHSYTKAIIGDAQPVGGSVRIDPIPYGHPMTKEDLLTKALREKNHLNGKDLDGGGYSAYDVLNPVAGKMEYPTTTRLLDAAVHNAKSAFGSRAMLRKNDQELDNLWSTGTPLDKALKTRQQQWDQIPDTARDAGIVMGLGVGL